MSDDVPLALTQPSGAAQAAQSGRSFDAPDASNEFTITAASVTAVSDITSTPLDARSYASEQSWTGGQFGRLQLFASRTTDVPPTQSGNRVSFSSLYSQLSARSICRGQAARGGPAELWENRVPQGAVACSYTFFPVVGRVSLGDGTRRAQWTAFVYCALYSRLPPPSGQGGVIHHDPQYTNIQTTGDNSGGIRVDMTHIGDQNAWLSIFSALQNTRAMDGYHLTLFPVVENGVFADRINKDGRHAWAIKGPSLGLAVAMAVLGGSPVMYTGYIKALFPNDTSDATMRTTYPGFRKPDVPDANMDYPRVGARVLSGQIASYSTASNPMRYGAPGLAISTIMENLNYVETVHFLPQKVQLALTVAMPIVVPYYNTMGERMETLIRSRNFVQTAFIIKMHARTYTCADAQDGRSVTALAPNIFIAATLAEATILGAFACTAFYQVTGFDNISRAEYVEQTGAASGPAIAYANEQRGAILARERKSAAANADRREEYTKFKALPAADQDPALRAYLARMAAVSDEKAGQRKTAALNRLVAKADTKAAAEKKRMEARAARIAKTKLKYAKGEKKAIFGKPKQGLRQTAARAILRSDDIVKAGMTKRTTRSAKQIADLSKVKGAAAAASAAEKAIESRRARQAEALKDYMGDAANVDDANRE